MRSRHLLLPTLALLAGSGAAHALDDIQIHGLVSQGYLLTRDGALFTPKSEDNGTFEFNEVALNVVATPIDRLRVGVQIATQDLGDSFNNELTLDWAYGSYSFGEVAKGVEIGVNAGRFKMGHGLYNDYRDLDMTRSSVFLPMAVYNPRWRDIMLAVNGIGANATIALGPVGSLELNLYGGTNNYDASEGPLHDTFSDTGMDPETISVEGIRGGQLVWNTPLDGLRLKYSLLDAAEFEAAGSYVGGGPFLPGSDYSFSIPNYWDNIFSAEFVWNELTVAGEYNYTFFHYTIEGNVGIPVEIEGTTAIHSTYLTAAYRLHPQWEVLGGWQWSLSDDSQSGKSKWYALNAAVRFDITDHWLIKAEYQWTHGEDLLRSAEQPDGTREEIWSLFAIKTTFDF
jgi:opacity protein-like surface antigen